MALTDHDEEDLRRGRGALKNENGRQMNFMRRLFGCVRDTVLVIGASALAFILASTFYGPQDYVEGHVSVRRPAPNGADYYGTLILVDRDGNPNSVHVDQVTYQIAQLGRWVEVRK